MGSYETSLCVLKTKAYWQPFLNNLACLYAIVVVVKILKVLVVAMVIVAVSSSSCNFK